MLNKKLIFLLYYSTVWTSILADDTHSNYDSFPAKEDGTCYKRVPYNDVIASKISKGIVKLDSGSQHLQQQAGVKTSNSRVWVTIIDCCDGFTRNPNSGQCETHCEEGCSGGTCTGPNVCTCPDGHYPEGGVCKPSCQGACPSHAFCYSPGFCSCEYGYEEIEGVCQPICLHGCRNGDCVGCPNGKCTQPGICSCRLGYTNPPNDQASCVPECQDGCFNGRCVAPNQCECDPGFVMHPQLRRCVESHADKPYESTRTNKTHEINYVTVPPDILYGNRGTPGPQVLNQELGTNTTFKGRQLNQSQDSLSHVKARETQGIITNRNGVDSEQRYIHESSGQHEIYGSNQTEDPSRVIGLKGAGQVEHKYGNDRVYGNNDYNQTQGRERSYVQSSSSTPDSLHTTDLYGTYGDNQSYHPSKANGSSMPESYQPNNPYGAHRYNQSYDQQGLSLKQNPRSFNRNNQTHRLQGPFPPLESHTFQEQNQSRSLYDNTGPYGVSGSNNTYQPRRPYDPQDVNKNYNPQSPYGNNQHKSQGPSPPLGPSQDQNDTQGSRGINSSNKNYGSDNHTFRPINSHNSSPTQGLYPTQELSQRPEWREAGIDSRNSPNINDPYGIDRKNPNRTNAPQGPYASQNHFPIQEVNSTPGPQNPYNSHGIQGKNPTYRPQETYDSRGFSSTPNSHNIDDPYGTSRSNPINGGERSYASQEPFPTRDINSTPNPQIGYSPYGAQKGNSRYGSEGPFPTQEITSTPNSRNINGPYGSQQNNPIFRPHGSYASQGPYNRQGANQPQNSYGPSNPHNIQGIKTSHRLPGTTQNPGLVNLAYGPHETYNPEEHGPFGSSRPYQPQGIPGSHNPYSFVGNGDIIDPYNLETGLAHGLFEPSHNPYNQLSSDNIGIGYVVVGAPIPGASQMGPICEVPCLNADCVGPNLCACRHGYEPDQNSPFGNVCLPVCHGGCLNGVCTAPNLCICNVGYVKERGVKSSAQHCILAY